MVSNLIVEQDRHCFLILVEFVCRPCLPKSSREVRPWQVRMIIKVPYINCRSVPLSLWLLVCIRGVVAIVAGIELLCLKLRVVERM